MYFLCFFSFCYVTMNDLFGDCESSNHTASNCFPHWISSLEQTRKSGLKRKPIFFKCPKFLFNLFFFDNAIVKCVKFWVKWVVDDCFMVNSRKTTSIQKQWKTTQKAWKKAKRLHLFALVDACSFSRVDRRIVIDSSFCLEFYTRSNDIFEKQTKQNIWALEKHRFSGPS